MSRSRSLLLTLFAVFALLVTACGDDDSTASSDESTSSEDEGTGGEADSGDEDESDAEEQAEDVLEGAMGGECGFLAQFATGIGDFDPTEAFTSGEPVDLGDLFVPLAEELGEVADAAPDDIEAAFRTMADAFALLVEELDGVVIDFSDPEGPDEEAMAKFASLEETFGNEDFEAAAEEIDEWLQANCADLVDRFDLSDFGG